MASPSLLKFIKKRNEQLLPRIQQELSKLIQKRIQIDKDIEELNRTLKAYGYKTPEAIAQSPNSIGGGMSSPDTALLSNGKLLPTPFSEEGIAIGLKLAEPFGAEDLRVACPVVEYSNSYRWMAQWKGKDWIESCGFGRYKRKESFGK